MRTAQTTKSVNPGGMDFTIGISDYNSPGVPLAIASWSLTGSGVTAMSVYRAAIETKNGTQQVNVAAKNTGSSAITVTAYVSVLFLE